MKNNNHIRIFLTTSQICTVYATMMASKNHKENDVDILFIDGSKRRQGLIEIITMTSKIYNWALFYDFSIPMEEDHDFTLSPLKISPGRCRRKYQVLVFNKILQAICFKCSFAIPKTLHRNHPAH